ncbi:unnamed protein product, partial [Aureobasidium pullulans]
MSASQQPTRPYFHNGQALSAFDPAAAAAASPFNANNRTPGKRPGWGFGGGSSNSRGGGPPPPGGRKVGRVDDVRGPECKSCK